MYAFHEMPAPSSWSSRLGASTVHDVQSDVIPNVEPPRRAR